MALVADRAHNLAQQGDADRVFTELPEGLIDLPSAARKYGISRSTLHNWIRGGHVKIQGRLKGSAQGGGFYVLEESELLAYMEAPRNKGGRPAKVLQ